MELSKKIKQHFRSELKSKISMSDTEILEPDVAPIIKPSPSKPKELPEEWDIKIKPKVNPTPKG